MVQVQLLVLCSRYQGYESSSPGCTIKFSEVAPAYPVNATSDGSVYNPPIPTVFTVDLAFNRPVLGPQSRNSLYGMLNAQGVPDGRCVACAVRITLYLIRICILLSRKNLVPIQNFGAWGKGGQSCIRASIPLQDVLSLLHL